MSFNGDRLRVLRRFHDYTQRGLAEHVASPASTINAYERGLREPKGIILDALCAALSVTPEYFFAKTSDDEFREHETNFRSLVETPDRLRKRALAHATLFGTLLSVIATKVKIPNLKLPAIQATTLDEIERAAERCRVDWGVGIEAPIQNVTLMLEHAGIVITVLDSVLSKQIDAFSRYGATNLIVLNPAKGSATRQRMDLGHEAAHGALHRNGLPADLKVREDQAKYFGSALLLPQRAFAREFWALGKARDWPALFELKQRWGASVAALVMRAYHLGLIDAAEYRRRYQHMSKAGWLRGGEPGEPIAESPQLFSLALRRYQSETGKSTRQIAIDLNWSPDLFRQVTGIDAQESEDLVRPDDRSIASFEAYRMRKQASN